MAIWKVAGDRLQALEGTSFAVEKLRERQDLQRLLQEDISVIAPDTLIIAEEYGEWSEGGRRIDLLGVDTAANLVVIELKRTETGGHMDLQAIRYAAMVSTMTFARAVDTLQDYVATRGSEEDAESTLLEFLGWEEPQEANFAQDVRIVLASAAFSKELTTSVIWLNERGLDIRCVRMKPYRLQEELLIDVQQVVPLPEAADYQVQVRQKAEEKRASKTSGVDFTRYDLTVQGKTFAHQWKRHMVYHVVRAALDAGIAPTQLEVLLPRGSSRFVSVDGECGEAELLEAMTTMTTSRGTACRPERYFTGEGELLHFEGRTYALSNQWSGKSAFKALSTIAAAHPELQIKWAVSGETNGPVAEEAA